MKLTLALTLLCFSFVGYSQKIKTTQGDIAPLKSQTGINIEFTYDNLSVGKFDKEEDYVAKKNGRLQ